MRSSLGCSPVLAPVQGLATFLPLGQTTTAESVSIRVAHPISPAIKSQPPDLTQTPNLTLHLSPRQHPWWAATASAMSFYPFAFFAFLPSISALASTHGVPPLPAL